MLASVVCDIVLRTSSQVFAKVKDGHDPSTLEIQHLRFADRMSFEIDASEEVRRCSVATLLLERLAENAVPIPVTTGIRVWGIVSVTTSGGSGANDVAIYTP